MDDSKVTLGIALHTGLVSAVMVLLRLLDSKGVLPKDEAIAALKKALDETLEGLDASDPLVAAQTMSYRALMLGLSDADPDADDQALMNWLAGTHSTDS